MARLYAGGLMIASAVTTVRRLLGRAWFAVALVALWWVWSADSTSVYFPALSKIVSRLADDWVFDLWVSDLVPSVRNLVLGFLIASAVGIGAGAVLGMSPRLRTFMDPIIHFLRAIPPPAFLPFGLVLLGTGAEMKVAVIALGAVWPTLLNAIDGVRSVESQYLAMAKVFQLPWRRKMAYVVLPAATPHIFAGLRTTLQISVILVVVTEMVVTTGGVGYYVLRAQQGFDITATWAGTVLLAVLGYTANGLLLQLEKRVLWWQREAAAIHE